MRRLEGRLLEVEAQASAAEEARAALEAELVLIRHTLEEDRASSDRHVQVCALCLGVQYNKSSNEVH